jgi:hypothetical protein
MILWIGQFAASGHEAIDQESTLRGAFFMRGVSDATGALFAKTSCAEASAACAQEHHLQYRSL